MPRQKKTNVRRVPLDLDLDDDDQKRLSDHLLKLADKGGASEWMRYVLIAALPVVARKAQAPAGKIPASGLIFNANFEKPPDEVHYEAIDE